MTTIVKMPQLGESVVEGTVARWLKAPGDRVAKLEPLLEISTDKIDTEVPAPAEGVLLEIIVGEGKTVRAGTPLATIGTPTAANAHSDPQSTDGPTVPSLQSLVSSAPTEKPTGRAFVSPVVGRMVAEHHLDLAQITGTGLGGRVTKKDVLAYLATREQSPNPPIVRLSAHDEVSQSPISNLQSPSLSSGEILHPLTAMRRAIAQHMVQSKQTSPHVTTIMEVDMTAVVLHREAHKTHFAEKGLRLTLTPYFVAATAAGLRQVPLANSRFTEQGLVLNRRIHIGVAVALTDGLIVPVIRDADEKNLQGLARTVTDLADRARRGALTPDEVGGGTFTITNHGTGGSLVGTPIINQPQAGILGLGAIVKRPVIRSGNGASLLPSADDAIVIRPMCYLSFTFDHRILDGAPADAFLMTVKETLEGWSST
jgi:2-oxoglutarate dehydrogenase E2 component (dihydrolipoamide succinyltransferase)